MMQGIDYLSFLILGAALGAAEFVYAQDWEEFDQYQGITMYRREVPGSSVLAYKGIGEISAPMAKVVDVILDTPRKPEWMSRIQQALVIRRESSFESTEYIHLGLPWPVKDRDFLYRVKLELEPEKKRAVIRYESIEEADIPERKDRVRVQLRSGVFVLTPTDDGLGTRVEAEAHGDPRGWIPKWVVNLYQRKLPRESLEGLMRQVNRPGVREHPLIQKMLKP